MLFFGIGLLIRQKAQEAERSIRWSNSLGILCVCGSIVYFSVHAYFGLEMYYFSRYAVIGNLLNLGTAAYLGQILMNLKKKELLFKIGDWSFAVYLLHQFVAGLVVAVTNHWDCFVLTLCRPWIILVITAGGVMVVDRLFSKKLCWVKKLIGIR